jgi:hypothetical protein
MKPLFIAILPTIVTVSIMIVAVILQHTLLFLPAFCGAPFALIYFGFYLGRNGARFRSPIDFTSGYIQDATPAVNNRNGGGSLLTDLERNERRKRAQSVNRNVNRDFD